jgi:hypothetical protein
MKKLFAVLACLSLTACSTMTDMVSGNNTVRVNLTGAQEVPPVSAAGSGNGSFTIAQDGAVTGSVTTTGVPGMMAHIHQGAPGQNGPIIIPLTKNGDTYSAPAGARLNNAQLQAFKDGNLYVNVHTPQNKGGEVRAQLQP